MYAAAGLACRTVGQIPVQVSSILQWRATAQQSNILLVFFEQLPGFQSLQGYINLKDIFKGIFVFVKIKMSLFFLFREIECPNFKWTFEHLNEGHKGLSMVQNRDRAFVFHNPKHFCFSVTHIRCDTLSQFSDSVAAAIRQLFAKIGVTAGNSTY